MRVLLVSVTTGFGHHMAALALAEALRSRGDRVSFLDLYRYGSPLRFRLLDRGYTLAAKHLRVPFGRLYHGLENSARLRRLAALLVNGRRLRRELLLLLRALSPDVVLCTHPLAAQALSTLKERELPALPVVGLVTDFCFHPLWEDSRLLDCLVTASPLLAPAAEARGIDPARLRPLGMPLRRAFLQSVPQAEARRALNLPPEGRIVLLMGGSMGCGRLFETARALLAARAPCYLVCFCGDNDRLAARLTALRSPRLRVLGFEPRVDLYMDAADCIVTKPGGLTLSELLVKRLPALLLDPIPGHEAYNRDFLLEQGCALPLRPGEDPAAALETLFETPGLLDEMRRRLARLARPDACRDICALLDTLKT